jgi:hypothetical protein
MSLSTIIPHFIAMGILPTATCCLEKIMMIIKVYNDILSSKDHKDYKDMKEGNYNNWNHLHLLQMN